MFCCLLLAMASQKERKQRWIIVHVLNIIINEFLPSSVHSSCWMQDAKSGQNIRLSKVCFDYDHLLSISYIFFTYLSIYSYLKTLKITFPPSIKGFQSLKGVWKPLISSFNLHSHFLPFIDHFRFLIQKYQNNSF